MAHQDADVSLQELLKKKGIGPEGSKSLKVNELELVNRHFLDPSVSMTTKATMLTALLLLEPNHDEKIWIANLMAEPLKYLPTPLLSFLDTQPASDNELINLIRKLIRKIELTEAESEYGMTSLFTSTVPEYLKGPFLEGERLKRETFTENKTFFNFLWEKSERIQTNFPILIDICDSYDGCTRTPNYSVFVASLLASAGFPTYLHAIDQVAPKDGITSHQILKAAGKNPLCTLDHVVKDLENKTIGWGYVDQQVYFPSLYQLKKMRKEMVKRPFLATFEKLLQPIRALQGNLIFTGYTHPHYRTELVNQLAEQKKCSGALIVKGAEGSTQLSMSKATTGVYYNGATVTEKLFQPEEFGLMIAEKSLNSVKPANVLREGLEALNGVKNYAYYNIIYTSALVLDAFGLFAKSSAKVYLEELIDSGKARQHWEKGCI